MADSTVMAADVPFVYRVRETPPVNPLPTRYDLRDLGWVTPVKSQIGNRANGNPDPGNSVGICWAMAAMAAFESSLLKQGITTDATSPTSSFSPWHLGNAIGQPLLHYNEPCYVYHGDIVNIPQFVTEPPTVYGQLNPTGLLGSKQVALDERGYHLVDLDSPIAIGAASDFIVSLTFAYHDQAEPLVYCSDTNLPPADTYVLAYTATSSIPAWNALTDMDDSGSLFIQAVFADP